MTETETTGPQKVRKRPVEIEAMPWDGTPETSKPIIAWVNRLTAEGIKIPVHIGIAGPAKLQTLVKFAIACGVGPSLRVLQKRAKDVTKLLLPFEPTDLLAELAAHKAANPNFGIESVHFFPLGGIKTNATWIADHLKG